MARKKIGKIGSVYEVYLDNGELGYFQCVAEDYTQLQAYVIRVFKKRYINRPALEDIVKDETQFYARIWMLTTVENVWTYLADTAVGYDIPDNLQFYIPRRLDINTNKSPVLNWDVWHINQREKEIKFDALTNEHKKAEPGAVMSYASIVDRMKTGKYADGSPEFQ